MDLYKVKYASGAFIDNFHYAENEIVEYEPAKGEKVLWGVLCDENGNELEAAQEAPNQTIAKSVGKPPQTPVTPVKKDDGEEAAKAEQRKREIAEATTLLEAENDEHWTAKGEAKMEALESILGYQITRKELDEAVPNFERPKKA